MTSSKHSDIVIIGAGMAGASAAWEIKKSAPARTVVLLERESTPDYHSSGRSAALYTESYAEGVFAKLTKASRPFLESPPEGFSESPLLIKRGLLFTAEHGYEREIDRLTELHQAATGGLRRLNASEARSMVPALLQTAVTGVAYEEHAMDIDVHALHQGFLKGFKALGGEFLCNAEVLAIQKTDGGWQLKTRTGTIKTEKVVNAAGAWADTVAQQAGLAPLGLTPKRRTVISIDPSPYNTVAWPMVVDAAERYYFKNDAGRLIVSPADATPCAPQDARPEELDMAIAVDHLQRVTDITVRRIDHAWAGLRSFFPDHGPVAGEDPRATGFYWLAGQGGYGIMTSPAMARLTASLVLHDRIPTNLMEDGITDEFVRPNRLS